MTPPGHVGALLEFLLIRPGRAHAVAELVDALWNGQPADPAARQRLRVTVSRLRKFLDDGDGDGLRVVRDGDAYRIDVTPASLDRLRFEADAASALGTKLTVDADAALAQWTGTPYSGSKWSAIARVERARLERLRDSVVELKVSADGGPSRSSVQPPFLDDLVLPRPWLVEPLPPVGAGQLIVVSAPAGFGKSTMLAQWASQQAGPVAWVAPDEEDDDPARWWVLAQRGLIAGGVVPSDRSGQITGSPASLQALQHDIRTAGVPCALVIDDLHHLVTAEATTAVAALVQTLLAAGATLAVGSRQALPAEVWRIAGRPPVHALEPADLRFRLDDVTSLFPRVERTHAERMWRATEGWPIAVVSLLRAGAAQPAGALSAPHDFASLASYVSSEVLAALPADLARFVLQIAPLDAFTVSLCDAVTGRHDAAQQLTRLRRHGLFIVETAGESDLDAGWFRFHHGIGAELRRIARSAVDVGQVHRNAALWHLDRGFKASALRYATAARDREVVETVAGDVLMEAVLRREYLSCVALIRSIHPDDVVDNPRAHAVCFWIAMLWLPQAERGPWLVSRVRYFGDADPLVLIARARNAFREGRATESVEMCERTFTAVEEVDQEGVSDLVPVLVGNALSELVSARMLQDTIRHDDPLFSRAVSSIRPFLPLVAAFVYANWALVAALDGDEAKARTLATEFDAVRRTTDAGDVPLERTFIGALLAAARTTDPAALRAIVSEMEPGMRRSEELGNTSSVAMQRLLTASIHRRIGDGQRARHYQRLADSVIGTFVDAPVFDRLRRHLDAQESGGALSSQLMYDLTPRQRSILPYLGTELSVAEIAATLHIGVNTLNGHLHAIYVRLGVHSRQAAAARLAHLDLA